MIRYFYIVLLGTVCVASSDANRRVSYNPGEWRTLASIGTALEATEEHADLSPVGVIVDMSTRMYGTGVLVSDRVVVTAGHVFKNSVSEPDPAPSRWRFYLWHRPGGLNTARVEYSYNVSEIHMHAGWTGRLHARGGVGDGDLLGVDIGVAVLSSPVVHVTPATLPDRGWLEPLGSRVMHAGYGYITNAQTGHERNIGWNTSMLLGGYNTLDRVREQIDMPHVQDDHEGGVLATDFDDGTQQNNALSSEYGTVGYIGPGDSSREPVYLESTTAAGDSGGPLFIQQQPGEWVLIGINSYGTKDPSVYGDISVYTRVQNHLDWLYQFTGQVETTEPDTVEQSEPVIEEPIEEEQSVVIEEPIEEEQSVVIEQPVEEKPEPEWRILGELGWVFVMPNGWCYHLTHGWIYIVQTDDHMWVWSTHVGWWWSNVRTYPQIWLHDQQSWSLVDVDRSNTKQTAMYVYRFDQWWVKTK